MTQPIFITGDRMMTPWYPGMVAIEMLSALGNGRTIATGDNDGVEAVVRLLAEQAGLDIDVVPTPVDAEGKPDWDTRHKNLGLEVVVVHMDPHDSRITKSLLAVLPENDVRLAVPV